MIPKPVRKLLFTVLAVGGAFFVLNTARIHAHQAVIAFKQFAVAVNEGNEEVGRRLAENRDKGLKMFQERDKRVQGLKGEPRLWAQFRVKRFNVSEDGKTADIHAHHVFRLDRFGANTFFGNTKVINRITAKMVKRDGVWRVHSYQDSFFP